MAFKNVVSRKSSFVISLFIAFSISLFVLTNSVFDSTEDGVRESFTESFTGDAFVRPIFDVPLSLFGDETPFTGDFTSVPILDECDSIRDFLSSLNDVDSVLPILSGRAVLDFSGRREPCFLFGTDATDYFSFMPSLKMISGKPFENGSEGLLLPRKFAQDIGAEIGSDIQFVVAAGLASKIQAVRLCGIYDYPSENEAFSRIAILDPQTFRELFDNSSSVSDSAEESALPSDMDDLFSGSFDDSLGDFDFEQDVQFEKNFAQNWNFLLIRSKNPSSVIKKTNGFLKNLGASSEAASWRSAAGSSALYLYFLRLILNAGIGVILFAGFIVVNNTLVVGMLDRMKEIGTMRAVGANRLFISGECACETMILAVFSGLFGIALGIVFALAVSKMNIAIDNKFLVQLFGSNRLSTKIAFLSLFRAFLVAVVLGAVAWIRPVFIALHFSPVCAMQGANR